jgi:hypothetical protein
LIACAIVDILALPAWVMVMNSNKNTYADFHRELPFWELDYTASAIDTGISHHSMDSQAPKKI